MVAVVAKLSQQIVQAFGLGHKHRWAQQGADVEFWRTLEFQQVFGQQDAQYVFFFRLKHWKARMRFVDHKVEQFVLRGLDVN